VRWLHGSIGMIPPAEFDQAHYAALPRSSPYEGGRKAVTVQLPPLRAHPGRRKPRTCKTVPDCDTIRLKTTCPNVEVDLRAIIHDITEPTELPPPELKIRCATHPLHRVRGT
jgi:hypothetical protein